MTIGKIFQIELNDDINLLDEHTTLVPDQIRGVLSRAGIRNNTIRGYSDASLSKLETTINLLAYGQNYKGNPYEYLVKSLDLDGLKVLEKSWGRWDYYPAIIGVNWNYFFENYQTDPPTTVIIYEISKIKKVELLYGAEQLLGLAKQEEKSAKEAFLRRR